MPLVILVGGKLTAGKDEFADRLVDEHGFKKLGMSDTLAESLYRLNPVIQLTEQLSAPAASFYAGQYFRYADLVDIVEYVEAKKNPEVRRLLQVLGTEVGRQLLGKNIWVEAAKKKILELTDAGDNVVITGIRFANEIDLENHLNFDDIAATSVYVNRPGLPEPKAVHASEAGLTADDFEFTLENDGTLEELPAKSDELLRHIRGEWE